MLGDMKFTLPLNPAALAVIVGHGAADATLPAHRLALYGAALLPLPATPAFAAASVAHFSRDVGLGGSILLHCVLVALAKERLRAACLLLQMYMCMLHVPIVLLGLAARRDWHALGIVAASSLAAWAARGRVLRNGTFELTDVLQRLIVVHVLLNL